MISRGASNAQRVVVLSGRIAAGKSTLAAGLRDAAGARVMRTQDLLREVLGPGATREAMQQEGARLDRETAGSWVARALVRQVASGDDPLLVVDSARHACQIEGIRAAFGAAVTHVHLRAPADALASRFAARPPRSGAAPLEGPRPSGESPITLNHELLSCA